MSMGTLEIGFKRYYEAQSMPPDRVSGLLGRRNPRKSTILLRRFSLAAMLTLVATCGLWIGGKFLATERLAGKVALEIALNHEKNKEVQYRTGNYRELEKMLDKLGFPLRPEGLPGLEQYQLAGGRYCSVDGEPAAQIKLRDPQSGTLVTLYVARSLERFARIRSRKMDLGAIQVRIWNQGGRFFGLAGEGIP